MTVMIIIHFHCDPYYPVIWYFRCMQCAHSLSIKQSQSFQHFLHDFFKIFFKIFTRFFTRCRVCLQNMYYKNRFFSLSLSLTIEPDSVQSERDISSEDSPPEKPVNGKHTSILPSQVPSHLLMISILEHLCQMYGQDAEQGKKLFQGKN